VLPHGGPTGQAEDYFSKTAAAIASRDFLIATGYVDPKKN
jgi:hypothetical protein